MDHGGSSFPYILLPLIYRNPSIIIFGAPLFPGIWIGRPYVSQGEHRLGHLFRLPKFLRPSTMVDDPCQIVNFGPGLLEIPLE